MAPHKVYDAGATLLGLGMWFQRHSGGSSLVEEAWLDHPDEWSGYACTDGDGRVLKSEGLALEVLRPGQPIDSTPLATIWRQMKRFGCAFGRVGSLRVIAEADPRVPGWNLRFVSAREEESLAERLETSQRHSRVLERVAQSLVQNTTVEPLAIAAAYSLFSSLDLAGCLIWIRSEDDDAFRLAASAGIDRGALGAFEEITNEGPPCAAWLSATQGRPLTLDRIELSSICSDVEGRWTGGRAGGLYVSPLTSSERVLGAFEVISRSGDRSFTAAKPLLGQVSRLLGWAIDRALAFEHMERQASFDPLTGIANHRTMQEFLSSRLSECRRADQALGVVMIDVDHFRQFNESCGHSAGDEVLRQVAQVLAKSVRSYDIAARYGGEEFALILPRAGKVEAMQAAERARRKVASLRLAHGHKVTVSCGVACCPDAAEEPLQLLKAADAALYRAKREGRNRVSWYGDGHDAPLGDLPLGGLVLSALPDGRRGASMALMDRSAAIIDGILSEFGLRRSHGDILCAAAGVWPHWRSSQMPPQLMREITAGDLRAVSHLLESVGTGDDSLTGAPERAFLTLLSRLGALRPSSRSPEAA